MHWECCCDARGVLGACVDVLSASQCITCADKLRSIKHLVLGCLEGVFAQGSPSMHADSVCPSLAPWGAFARHPIRRPSLRAYQPRDRSKWPRQNGRQAEAPTIQFHRPVHMRFDRCRQLRPGRCAAQRSHRGRRGLSGARLLRSCCSRRWGAFSSRRLTPGMGNNPPG